MPKTPRRTVFKSTAPSLLVRKRILPDASRFRRSVDGTSVPTRAKRTTATRILVVASDAAERQQLAASVAAELDRALVRVDLRPAGGKYIGETEKNLEKAFAAAESSEAILFFDEADALFGRRTTVKDAHDRYADQAVSYLLQHIETSRAVIVLATSAVENIDPKFYRRLRFAIKLAAPVPLKRPQPTKSTVVKTPLRVRLAS